MTPGTVVTVAGGHGPPLPGVMTCRRRGVARARGRARQAALPVRCRFLLEDPAQDPVQSQPGHRPRPGRSDPHPRRL